MPREGKAGSIDGAGLVIVDKEPAMTSHDVVSRCRRILRTRKVGHAGTLDPMATGVIVLGVERATKMLGLLTLATKEYTATIRLGQSRTSDDADGDVMHNATPEEVSAVSEADVLEQMAALTGTIDQIPAAVSAIKVNGRRAHALVREGREVNLAARRVTVSAFTALNFRRDDCLIDIDVHVECSSGTYVRALARDIGQALGIGGHLTALRRTRVGPFTLHNARTFEQLEAASDPLSFDIDAAAKLAFPQRGISESEADTLCHGRWLEPVGLAGICVAVHPDGRAIALVEEKGRRASPVFVIRPATLI